ncbi:MAG: hypothetical protein SGARI_006271, partial [Bacillariaceae sp.]
MGAVSSASAAATSASHTILELGTDIIHERLDGGISSGKHRIGDVGADGSHITTNAISAIELYTEPASAEKLHRDLQDFTFTCPNLDSSICPATIDGSSASILLNCNANGCTGTTPNFSPFNAGDSIDCIATNSCTHFRVTGTGIIQCQAANTCDGATYTSADVRCNTMDACDGVT